MTSSKKTAVLRELFELCDKSQDIITFSNNDIREIAQKHKFKNHFDVTKIDNEKVLPSEMLECGFKMILFDKTCSYIFRRDGFQAYSDDDLIENIALPRNPFMQTKCCSENSCVMFLPKLISNFLEMDVQLNVGIFGRQRNVKIIVEINESQMELTANQIDIDMSYYFEHGDDNYIVYSELKKSKLKSFNVNQLYHCLKYNEYVSQCNGILYIPILLMVKSFENKIQISQYEFANKNEPWSIYCIKTKSYDITYG